jgi:RND family efflux transporter MFP subunit
VTKTSFQSFTPIASRWLKWQCKMISDVKLGAVFIYDSSSNNQLDMIVQWPYNKAENMTAKLHELAQNVILGQASGTSKITCTLEGNNTICDATALPIRYDNEVIGAVVFMQSLRSQEQKKAVFQLFQWGCAWLESNLAVAYEEQNQLQPLITDLAKLAVEDELVELTAHKICNLLAQELGCSRVAIGLSKTLQMQTIALSNQLRFDSRSKHIREMETVMEEAMDQNKSVVYPQTDDMSLLVTHKHRLLSENSQDSSILTVVLSNANKIIGTILLLRDAKKPFTNQEITILQHAIDLVGPVISLKLKNEYSMGKLISQKIKKKVSPLFDYDNLALQVSVIAAVTILIILSILKIDYTVYAKSSLEGAIQQVIVAPQDGFIKSAEIRAGDMVKPGQTLATLNERDLKLESQKLFSQHNKISKEYQEALAQRERAKVSILSAQLAQIDAQLSLISEKLKRSELKAPFAGVVVSGDLSQSIGAPVEKGEQLFEIASLGDYRVALSIDDHDVSKIKIGQTGSLRLVGLPYDPLPITITRIIPVASAQDGGNYFRVEAIISKMDKNMLRPGMQGIAKVEVSQESVLWVWTHTVIERLRLWLWSIGV